MIRIEFKHLLPLLFLCSWTGLLVPGAAGTVTNEPAGEVSLSRAIELARERHLGLGLARLDVKAAEGRVTQAAVRQNPTLSIEAENIGGKNEMKGFDSAEYTAQVEQPLELGGKRSKREKAAKLDRDLASFDLVARQLDVDAETVRRFVALQGAQEQVALNKEFAGLVEEFASAVAARVQAGKVSPLEEEKAKMLVARQKSALYQAEKEVDKARVQLSTMWGSLEPRFDRAAGNLSVLPGLSSLKEISGRIKDNPDVGRGSTEVEHRKALLRKEKAGRLPDLTVAGGVRRFNDTGDGAYVFGVSVPLPLFDRNQGGVREAAALLEKAEQQQRATETEVSAGLLEAYQSFCSLSNQVAVLKSEIIPRAQSVYDSVKVGYGQGKFSYLEVQDAQKSLFEVKGEYVEAVVSCHKAIADVERLAGIRRQ